MASPVPYTGDTKVSPQLSPTPGPNLNTPIAAFGGLSADAATHLGSTLDQVGNELFARANAMEQLHQEGLANEAATQYSTTLGQKQAQFLTTEGKDAPDGLMGFIQDANDTRSKIREGLSSPYAQSLYDRDSRSLQNWSTRSASLHAATEGKKYTIGALNARIDEAQNLAGSLPFDSPAHDQAMDGIKSNIAQRNTIQGTSPDVTSRDQQKEVSKYISNRLILDAKSEPFRAADDFERANRAGQLDPIDAARTQDAIKKQQYTVGSRNEAGKILAGDQNWAGEKIVSAQQARDGIKAIEGGNYSIEGPMTYHNGQMAGRGQGAYMVMEGNLPSWLKEAGMPAMTKYQFQASPQAQDKLFDFKFGQYMQKYGSFNNAARAWFTGNPNAPDDASDRGPGFKGHTVEQYLTTANAALARGSSQTDLAAEASKRAKNLDPNDPVLADTIIQRTQAVHGEDLKVQADAERDNKAQVMTSVLAPNKDGKLPTTVEEMIANDPDKAKAWDAVKPGSPDYITVMHQLERNAKGPGYPTDDQLNLYKQLRGESMNDPDTFMARDVTKLDLTPSLKKEMIGLQMKVQQKAEADPNTSYAMKQLGPILYDAGVTKQRDPTGYNQFTGSLFDEIRDFQNIQKRPPKAEEIQQIGKQLLQKQGAGWFTSGTEVFRTPVPEEAVKAIREDPAWAKQGISPSDEDIRKIYVRSQFNKLYGKPSQ